jgi:NhaP-type Na+/H+ or K+/H+ antiporter
MIENPILSLAFIFVSGFFLSRLIKKLKIPTVTAYLALGILISPYFLKLISPKFLQVSEVFSNIVLGMIAFSLGESLSLKGLRRVGKAVTSISIFAALGTWVLITFSFWFIFKHPLYIALVLGAIASATDPASTVIVTQEYKSKGRFTDTLLGIVAIDDAWALIIFALSISFAKSFVENTHTLKEIFNALRNSLIEIGGSFFLGWFIALVFNRFTFLITSVRDRLIYTIGFLLLTIGLSISFNLSVLLACMFMGTILANTNRLSGVFFESLRGIDAPLYLIFFVLVGATLKIDSVLKGGLLVLGFILFRTLGKFLGAFIGSIIVKTSSSIKKYMGLALLPQAGVALACALVAKHTLKNEWGDAILTITIAATVIFELIGPSITKFSLVKAREIKE